jgi:V8-like Glu-specific endopeptidase
MLLKPELLLETSDRYEQRTQPRHEMLERIKNFGVLGANDPELVAKRLKRLRAVQPLVEQMENMNRSFTPTGPGVAPKAFPRSLERVMGTNDLIGIRFFDQGMNASRAVARVQVHDQQGRSLGYGTGFLVSPRLFLTNNHVLDSVEAASASQAEFNFQENGAGAMQPSDVFAFTPAEFFLTDKEHDYTLVSIIQDARLMNYGWLPLIPQTGKLVVGETVNIIQHPNGEPKQLAIRDNKVIDELELYLHYRTDTAPGSSGSPVFNDQWEVVALHHSGVPHLSPEGKIQSTDGRDWEEWMGEQRIDWIANEGVRVSRLVQHVQAQDLTGLQRQLVEEMLAAKPPERPSAPAKPPERPSMPVEQPPAPWGADEQQVEAAGQGAGLPPAQGHGATWTIPLQVSVSLGQASLHQPEGAMASEGLFVRQPARQPANTPTLPAGPMPSYADFSLSSLSGGRFQWRTALSLALATQLAYEPPANVQATSRAWGFSDCQPISRGDAQCFVATTADLVLVCFRGTTSLGDWLSNLNLSTINTTTIGTVHSGFLGQFNDLRQRIEIIFASRPGRNVILSGHSLGGALAALGAATWTDVQPLLGLYTYGQPLTGQDDFAAIMEVRLGDRYLRFVNDTDVVPWVPPGYRHAGRLVQFDAAGRLKVKPWLSTGAKEGAPMETSLRMDGDPALSIEAFRTLQQNLRTTSGSPVSSQEGFNTFISDHRITEYSRKIQGQIR